ncbi:hypothetical protein EWM64_g9081 [Hericium alpestre]|uniref:F-box domain-containing protein n=1 Tax=Hericium alpestre TaxID=135208 RepID=A0A4Y9ZJN2_9AGAM|nr:hypothetical protein EWM64_g9081 [Hericium alpestre]
MDPDNFDNNARDYWTACLRTRLVSTDGVTAFSSMEVINRTHTMLLADFKAVQHLATLTMARISGLAITARLPVEVLLHIFTILTECNPPSLQPRRSRKACKKFEVLGWINVTHVCQRWRQVALSAPGLWTNVGVPQAGIWMDEMLARSKQVPFTLSACIPNDPCVRSVVLRAIDAKYVSRMKHLHLSGTEHTDGRPHTATTSEVLAGLTHPAPMLESLILDDVTGSTVLRPDIFARHLPRLRCFAISRCEGLHWDAPYLRNLTDLELGFDKNFKTAELLTLLRVSPLLENLRITRRGPSDQRTALPDEKVSLPSLKRFFLDCRADAQCADLLERLVIPPTARRKFIFFHPVPAHSQRLIALATEFTDAAGSLHQHAPAQVQTQFDKGPHYSELKLNLFFHLDQAPRVALT